MRSSLQLLPSMIQCQQCGQGNADNTQYCRFCGNRLTLQQPSGSEYQQAPPRPYSWKTDEYQTQSEPRVRRQDSPQQLYQNSYPPSQPLAYAGPQYLNPNYRCPNCGTTVLPVVERRISTAGWITFALLLVFTFVFFWIGLLMKQDYRVCPVCRATLS